MSKKIKKNFPVKKLKKTEAKKIVRKESVKKEIIQVEVVQREKKSDEDSFIDAQINKNHIAEFFKMVEKGVRKHGVQKIASVLRSLDIQTEISSKHLDKLVKRICDSVVNDYRVEKIKPHDLFNKTKRGEVTSARKMAIILLKQFLEISDDKLGKFFGRSRQVIHSTMQEFKDLNPKNKYDAMFLDRHDKISNEIMSFIEDGKT